MEGSTLSIEKKLALAEQKLSDYKKEIERLENLVSEANLKYFKLSAGFAESQTSASESVSHVTQINELQKTIARQRSELDSKMERIESLNREVERLRSESRSQLQLIDELKDKTEALVVLNRELTGQTETKIASLPPTPKKDFVRDLQQALSQRDLELQRARAELHAFAQARMEGLTHASDDRTNAPAAPAPGVQGTDALADTALQGPERSDNVGSGRDLTPPQEESFRAGADSEMFASRPHKERDSAWQRRALEAENDRAVAASQLASEQQQLMVTRRELTDARDRLADITTELLRTKAAATDREVELAQLRMRSVDLEVTNRALSTVLSALHEDVRSVGRQLVVQSERTQSLTEVVQRFSVAPPRNNSVSADDGPGLQRAVLDAITTVIDSRLLQQQPPLSTLMESFSEVLAHSLSPLTAAVGSADLLGKQFVAEQKVRFTNTDTLLEQVLRSNTELHARLSAQSKELTDRVAEILAAHLPHSFAQRSSDAGVSVQPQAAATSSDRDLVANDAPVTSAAKVVAVSDRQEDASRKRVATEQLTDAAQIANAATAVVPPDSSDGEGAKSASPARARRGKRVKNDPTFAVAAAAAEPVSASTRRVVIAFSGIEPGDRNRLSAIATNLNAAIVAEVDGSVTHLVCDVGKRTFKLLAAPLVGAWIMLPRWLEESERAQKFVPEEKFGRMFQALPFQEDVFFLSPRFFVEQNESEVDTCRKLITLGGGKLSASFVAGVSVVLVVPKEPVAEYRTSKCITWTDFLATIPTSNTTELAASFREIPEMTSLSSSRGRNTPKGTARRTTKG